MTVVITASISGSTGGGGVLGFTVGSVFPGSGFFLVRFVLNNAYKRGNREKENINRLVRINPRNTTLTPRPVTMGASLMSNFSSLEGHVAVFFSGHRVHLIIQHF